MKMGSELLHLESGLVLQVKSSLHFLVTFNMRFHSILENVRKFLMKLLSLSVV